MKNILFFLCLLIVSRQAPAQKSKTFRPFIQPCDCRFRVDSSYIAAAPPALKADSVYNPPFDSSFQRQCGYLVVPENRKKASSRLIRLPFIIVKSKNPAKKKDPVLFTSGGPGNSSLGWASGITRSSLVQDRDCIAFEQRGTRFAVPYLRTTDLDMALREAYRYNLSIDSMTIVGVKRYRQTLERKGIDLAGYNSDETVADIHDLLTALQIDSVNLMGGSYSGGLMMAVLQKDPAKIRSLVLDSPLPMFTAIDEDEPVNFNEALDVLAARCVTDSADQVLYGDLAARFRRYFTAITNTRFYFPYVEKGSTDTLQVQYTKNELLDAVVRNMNAATLKDVPFIINEIIRGNHAPYIRRYLDRIFNVYPAPDGMRISVYCADQAAYHSEAVIQQLYTLYPYMRGYRINDVYKAMCDCWKAPPVSPVTKQAFYSPAPALIADGAMDPACRPLYMAEISHYLPNAQCFLFNNRAHGVGGKEMYGMVQQFIDNPYRTLVSPAPDIIRYRVP